MKQSDQGGFGLILMIVLITIASILIGATTFFISNAAWLGASRINQVKAYYLAQGAVMQSLHDFDDSWGLDSSTGTYAPLPLSANSPYEILNTDFKSNSAFFMTDAPSFNAEWWPLASPPVPNPPSPVNPAPPNLWCTVEQTTDPASNYRLHGWTVMNIRNNVPASTNNNLIVTGVRVWWTGADTLSVSKIRLNKTTTHTTGGVTVFSGTAAKGALINLTAATATNRTLTPGQKWTGPCTFIQWSGGPMPDPSRVSVQFIFDTLPVSSPVCPNNPACSTSHEVVLWDGLLNGQGRPHVRTLSITATGDVRVGKFSSRKKLRATFAYMPKLRYTTSMAHAARLMSWENLDT